MVKFTSQTLAFLLFQRQTTTHQRHLHWDALQKKTKCYFKNYMLSWHAPRQHWLPKIHMQEHHSALDRAGNQTSRNHITKKSKSNFSSKPLAPLILTLHFLASLSHSKKIPQRVWATILRSQLPSSSGTFTAWGRSNRFLAPVRLWFCPKLGYISWNRLWDHLVCGFENGTDLKHIDTISRNEVLATSWNTAIFPQPASSARV